MAQSQSQYSLTWDSFKTNICNGFSAFQQNGEFVDMTLAADGYFVKVHQAIVALASPYLKNIMASTTCQHPVIFLNNVPHKVLCYLLEYIYSGEVVVPSEYLTSFTDTAKELHIKGLENVASHTLRGNTIAPTTDNHDSRNFNSLKRKSTIDVDQMNLPRNARKVFIKPEGAHMSVNQSIDAGNDSQEFAVDTFDDTALNDSDDDFKGERHSAGAVNMDQVTANPSNLLYTVSIRGSLQAILNRYIYNLNSTTSRTGVRRWRCVDYRNNKCNAYIVTKGNLVTNRSHLHNHPFHDKKILSKVENKAVFSALDDVEAYREKEKAKDEEDKIQDTTLGLIEDTKSE